MRKEKKERKRKVIVNYRIGKDERGNDYDVGAAAIGTYGQVY
jgi:hypothetical protein